MRVMELWNLSNVTEVTVDDDLKYNRKTDGMLNV